MFDGDRGRSDAGHRARTLENSSLAILLGLACLTPWAYGSVDARAEVAIESAIAALAALNLIIRWRNGWPVPSACLPSLALAGLALLAAFQTLPLPTRVLAVVAPSNQALRASLVPGLPVQVPGDPNPAVAAPSPVVSLEPEATRHSAAQLAAAWMLFQCAWGHRGGYAFFRRFGMILAGNACLLTLFSMAQSLTWSGKIYDVRPSPIRDGWLTGGPFVCHNHLAASLNLGLGFAMGFLFASRPSSRGLARSTSWRWGRQVWAGYACGLIVVGVLASHSRTGFLAMLASAVVTVVVLRPRAVRLGIVMVTLLVVMATLLVALGSASPFRRLATILPYATDANIRTEIWRETFRAWREHPVVGLGLGSFAASVGPYFSNDRGVYFSHAENEYLQILAEGGILGFGLTLAGVVGVARLGRRALAAAPTILDRTVVAGSLFSLMALAFQGLGDFAPRIPGVGVPALILCALLCRLGRDARLGDLIPKARSPFVTRLGSALGAMATIGLSLAILVQGHHRERAEVLVAGAGLPLPESQMPAVNLEFPAGRDLVSASAALEAALRERPDWAEGHIRLGMIHLGLYGRMTARSIEALGNDPTDSARRADPLSLHGLVHGEKADSRVVTAEIARSEAVRLHLVPAARCFLEARRCGPVLALPHARLASLDFLLGSNEPEGVHAWRALRLAGSDSELIALTARVAAQSGDFGQAARCWRRMLEIGGRNWKEAADAAGSLFHPEQILRDVLPSGGALDPLRFADRLYAAPEADEGRRLFLREALVRAPFDSSLSPPERTWLEAQATARLDDRARATALMRAAMADEPARSERRQEFATWMIRWGDLDEARRQARIGLELDPGHAGLGKALEAADSMARRTRGTSRGRQDQERGRSSRR